MARLPPNADPRTEGLERLHGVLASMGEEGFSG
jgi:hypothetical protein